MCFIDLDGFKTVNDSFGHDVGDQLLVAVAARLGRALSPAELLVRLGGDEFVVLVADSTGAAGVVDVAEKVLAALATPLQIGDHALSIGASIGIVERTAGEGDHADLLRAADSALYRAKAEGKGRWAMFDIEGDARRTARPLPEQPFRRKTDPAPSASQIPGQASSRFGWFDGMGWIRMRRTYSSAGQFRRYRMRRMPIVWTYNRRVGRYPFA
ncbi:hypothetical protein FAIPA1_20003 [Frankia sp. AiPs1]|nr:GGDEF domain-containing protein [Frankia sp. AiPa1]